MDVEASAREARALMGLECPRCRGPLDRLHGSGKVCGPNGVVEAPELDTHRCPACEWMTGDGPG